MRRIKNRILLYLIIPLLDLVMGTRIFYYYRVIRKMNTWDAEQVREWQNEKLQKLIRHFYLNSPFYKELFQKLLLTPDDIRTVDDLKKIPPLTKEIILENYERLIPENINGIKHKTASTGGSTGNPLRFLISLDAWSYTTAIKIYSWQTTSYKYGDSYAALGSSSLFPANKKSGKHLLYYFLRNGIPLNGMNLSDEKLASYVVMLKAKKVKYLYGYASALYLLARYVNKNDIELNIKGCFPTSEILLDSYRTEMEKAFGGFVMDTYGARDGGITAYEINSGYYNVGYNSFAELINPSKDNTGTLLVTDLLNFAFPFIRYEVGDEVVMPENTKEYNYNGQVFNRILGRLSNVIHLDNGRVLTGPGFTILFKDLNVVAYRTTQINGSKIKIEIHPGEDYSEEEEKTILGTFRKHAGEDCLLEIVYVEGFQTSSNGKRLFFINK